MLKFGNKAFRNLEEQVLKNQQDITRVQAGVLIDRTITESELSYYTTASNLGKYYLVESDDSKSLYLISRDSSNTIEAVYLSEWPLGIEGPRGPQGEKGPKGDSIIGPRGYKGDQGAPGRGMDSLSAIDATDYEGTYTQTDDMIEMETSADVEFGVDSQTIDLKLKYQVPTNFYTQEQTTELIATAKEEAIESSKEYTDLAIENTVETMSQEIEEALDDKADLSDFNTLVNTVDSLSTAVSNKANQSDLTAVANRVTTAEGNIATNTTDIGSLEYDYELLKSYVYGYLIGEGIESFNNLDEATLGSTITINGITYQMNDDILITLDRIKGNFALIDGTLHFPTIESISLLASDGTSILGTINVPSPSIYALKLKAAWTDPTVYDELIVTKNENDGYFTITLIQRISDLNFILDEPIITTLTTTAQLTQVSSIREIGGKIKVNGNSEESNVKPSVDMKVTYRK